MKLILLGNERIFPGSYYSQKESLLLCQWDELKCCRCFVSCPQLRVNSTKNANTIDNCLTVCMITENLFHLELDFFLDILFYYSSMYVIVHIFMEIIAIFFENITLPHTPLIFLLFLLPLLYLIKWWVFYSQLNYHIF